MVMDIGCHSTGDESENPKRVAHGLIRLLIESGVLTFGEFTLKSGRVSPYFMNFGKVSSGKAFASLGGHYSSRIAGVLGDGFDVVFGPAYKGIPLAFVTAARLADGGLDVGVAYNRKEAKDHGEGGNVVGADLAGKNVVIVDDVITAGTALGEAVEIIRNAGGIPVAAFVAFDRMEKGKEGDMSAVQEAKGKYGFPVYSIANLDDLLSYLESDPEGSRYAGYVNSILDYRALYGADYSR